MPDSLLLNAKDVATIVDRIGRDVVMDGLIDRLADTIRELRTQEFQAPERSGFSYDQPAWGLLEWMPAYFQNDGATVKLVGSHPSNPESRNLPSVLSTICVFDTSSGGLKGLVDGTLLTALRTGAASAVASRVLGHPDSTTLGIFGCGAQSVTQAQALCRVFPIERILAYDIDPHTTAALGDRLAFTGLPVEPFSAAGREEMLEQCDILCTCTSAEPGTGPVLPDFTPRDHLHINAVGSDFADKFEVPVDLLRKGLVCPDFRGQAMIEGECQQLSEDEIGPDFCGLLEDEGSYRSHRDSLTVFDSTGWAVEDHVAASFIIELARELGVGQDVSLGNIAPDPKDPYSMLGNTPPSPTVSNSAVAATTSS